MAQPDAGGARWRAARPRSRGGLLAVQVHARLGESDNPEARVRAVSLLWQLWQQAAARWPALPHGLQLAEALARTANRSVLVDP